MNDSDYEHEKPGKHQPQGDFLWAQSGNLRHFVGGAYFPGLHPGYRECFPKYFNNTLFLNIFLCIGRERSFAADTLRNPAD